MSANRPTLRNVTEFRVPMDYFVSADWCRVSTKLATDVVAQASRQWLDFWLGNANRAMALWWGALPPPPGGSPGAV